MTQYASVPGDRALSMSLPNRGYTYRRRVEPEDDGVAVLDWLVRLHTHSPLSVWAARIVAGEVEVAGRHADADRRLRPGEEVAWHRPPWVEAEVPLKFGLVHEDADLLVVTKPAGLPTVPAGGFLENTLLARVRERWPEVTPMHRLGRGTSGVVLFARTAEARSALQRAWREGRVDRRYRALAQGELGDVRIDVPIGRLAHAVLGGLHAAHPGGRSAHSEVTALERRTGATLVDIAIATGRPHQIRIHLAAIGHPLVGEPLYGPGGLPKPESTALPGDGGFLLHAFQLGFSHPTGNFRMWVGVEPVERLRLGGDAPPGPDGAG